MKNIWMLTLCLASMLSADISGVGYAQTNKEAKKEALGDLSQVIKSEVRSNFESKSFVKGDKGNSSSSSNIKISSNLPILGADFTFIDRAMEVEARVELSPHKVKALYTKKLQNIKKELDSISSEIGNTSSSSSTLKLQLYSDAYSLLKEYDRYESVAMILGSKLPNRPTLTKAKVKLELAKLDSNIDSLDMASRVLAKSFKNKNIFVYPPLMQSNTTVAQFGAVFVKKLKAKVKSVKSPKNASYLLVGEYVVTKKMMVLNYELLSIKTNEIVASKTININKKAYKNIQVKPKNIDFDALLNSGVISSSSLKVSLNSNRGSENLLFNKGEDIELFVKLNKMGYIYIVGYTQTKEGSFSYLLELSEGNGNSRFVKFINADDASRWISLGEFTVEPPFGVESIQVIASNRKINSLPSVSYDEKSGYYIISKDIKKALVKTRGIKKKKSKKTELSEDVMSFTTIR
ncbi:FlgO family outer membrane protein [Sulfurimonas sp.]|uniref:FlgO family outer membrane protein n=1 Tax=Sulfurimonas sp. TaxID=2022749 RepID=UPI002AB1EB61|nr:FlgO family outer membrane protein [Sulfurimonas sp.]